MLNVFRENLRHLKPILWIVAGTFVVFFGTSWYLVDPSGGDPWVAKVNRDTIPQSVWAATARNLEERYRQMFGQQYEQMRDAINIPRQAAEQLVQQKVVVQEARRLGLRVPDAELAQFITSLPGLQRDGRFIGREQYEQAVRRGLLGPTINRVEDFEQLLREDLLASKWENLMQASVVLAPGEIEQEFKRRNEKVAFDYVALPVESFEDQVEANPVDVEAWYEAHRDRYAVGEARRALYVMLDDEAVSDRIEISEEDVAAYYDENQQLFNRPEERRARQILIRVEPDAPLEAVEDARQRAASLAERARAGEEFAALASSFSEDEGSKDKGGDLGFFPRGRMVPEFDEAVFAMQPGEVSDPVRTDYGFHVILLEEIREGGVRPLDEVREQIKGQLRFQRLKEVAQGLAADLRAAAQDVGLEEAAAEMGLEVRDTGMISRSDTIPGLGPVPQMIQAIFEAEPDTISEVVSLPRGDVVFSLREVVSDFLPPINAQRERVISDYKQEQASELASERLDAAIAAAGGELADVAERVDAELLSMDPPLVRGQEIPEVGVDPAVEAAAFAASVNELVGPVTGASAVVALRVTEKDEADPEALEGEKAAIASFLRAPRVQALIQKKRQALREQADVRFNPAVVPPQSAPMAPAEGGVS